MSERIAGGLLWIGTVAVEAAAVIGKSNDKVSAYYLRLRRKVNRSTLVFLGSARVSRVGADGSSSRACSEFFDDRESSFRRDAETDTRDACATQKDSSGFAVNNFSVPTPSRCRRGIVAELENESRRSSAHNADRRLCRSTWSESNSQEVRQIV